MRIMNKNLMFIKKVVAICTTFFIFLSCDFTPRLHKDILKAQEYVKNQSYSDAVRLYESMLDSNLATPIKVKVFYQLGELYSINLRNNKKALYYYKLIKKITDNQPSIVSAEEKIAEINFTYLKNYKDSSLSYHNLSSITPKLEQHDFYEFRYGLSSMKNEDYKASMKVFQKISKSQRHKYFVKSLYYIGLIYFQQKEWMKAVKMWKTYINIETRRDSIVQTKFLMANAYETIENLKLAYDLYYSIMGEYPNTEVIKDRLNSIYKRKVSRKR